MILKSEILEVASILDDFIDKAFEEEKTSIDVLEEQISKSLSHDPFRPVLMDADQPYYNPYMAMPDGTFLPHPVKYWEDQGKRTGGTEYLTTKILYEQYLAPTENKFATLRRSLEKCDLIKAGAVPVGTVHVWQGDPYKKVAEGKWVPAAGQEGKVRAQAFQENWLNHKDPQRRAQAAQHLDREAAKLAAVKDELGKRGREERVKDESKKDTLKVVHQAMSHIFDGDMPQEIKGFFDKHIQPEKTPTIQKWKQGDAYKPERKDLHEKILKPIDKVKPVPPPEGQKPVAIFSAGGAGSGKSSVLKHHVMPHMGDNLAYISADDYKEQLPEYKQLLNQGVDDAAPLVHDESSDLAAEAVNRAIEGGKPFVYDSTMKNTEKFSKLIQKLKDRGYEVHIVFAHLDPEKAKARAKARQERTKRKVDEKIVEESNKDARKSLMALKHLADSVRVYSTEKEGQPPELIHQEGKDKLSEKLNKSEADSESNSNSDVFRQFMERFEGGQVGDDEIIHHGESPDFDKRLKYKGEKK